jgi:hypothetical protein
MSNEFTPDWNENAALVEEIQDLALELEQTKKDFLMQTDAAMELLKTVDRARSLLQRCDTEMHYAGWATHTADNPQRRGLYADIVEFLRGVNHWKLVGSITNNKGG